MGRLPAPNSRPRFRIRDAFRRLLARCRRSAADSFGPPLSVTDASGTVSVEERRLVESIRRSSTFEQASQRLLDALVRRARDGFGLVLTRSSGEARVRAWRGLREPSREAFVRVVDELTDAERRSSVLEPRRFRELGLYDALTAGERLRGQEVVVCSDCDVVVVHGRAEGTRSHPGLSADSFPRLVESLASRVDVRSAEEDEGPDAEQKHAERGTVREAVTAVCGVLATRLGVEQVSFLVERDGAADRSAVRVGPSRLPGVAAVWRSHERRVADAAPPDGAVRTLDRSELHGLGVDTLVGWACVARVLVRGRAVGVLCLTHPSRLRGSLAASRVEAGRDAVAQLLESSRASESNGEPADTAVSGKDLLAYASHEIRTPMNGILGMTKFLEETATTPEQRHYLDVLRSTSEDLLRTVDGVLDVARGRHEARERPTGLRRLLGSATRSLGGVAVEKGVSLVLDVAPDVPDRVVLDDTGLRQVVLNLVGNALKFTSQGEVVVTVQRRTSVAEGVTSEVVGLAFEVRDTGIGIPQDRLDAIFEDFEQAESTTRERFGGTGLGLGICREVVERMGGRLTARSSPGVGSVFSFDANVSVCDEWSERESSTGLEGQKVRVSVGNASLERAVSRQLVAWGAELTASPLDASLAVVDRDGQSPHDPARSILLAQPGESGGRCDAVVLQPFSSLDLAEAVRGLACQDVGLEGVPEGEEEAAKQCVLLVDDDPVNRVLCSEYVRRAGFEPVAVGDGRSALAMVETRTFAAILLDVSLPDVLGDELATELRARDVASPLIAVTGYTDEATAERLYAAGVDAKIEKPVDEERLVETLRRLVLAVEPSDLAVVDDEPDDVFVPSVDDPELIDELVALHLETAPAIRADLRAAVAGLDGPGIAANAHRLKGAVAVLGGRACERALARLENCECEADAVATAMDAAERETDRLHARFRTLGIGGGVSVRTGG